MDPTILLDGARPSNNCILPSILGKHACTATQHTNPKSTFASVKINKFDEIPFYKLKKSEKDFDKPSFVYSEFVKCKKGHFH